MLVGHQSKTEGAGGYTRRRLARDKLAPPDCHFVNALQMALCPYYWRLKKAEKAPYSWLPRGTLWPTKQYIPSKAMQYCGYIIFLLPFAHELQRAEKKNWKKTKSETSSHGRFPHAGAHWLGRTVIPLACTVCIFYRRFLSPVLAL